MKWLVLTTALFFSVAASAGTVSSLGPKSSQASTKVDVINGKRFYSLQNVRRFNGGTNTPKAMSIVNHPRQQAAAPVVRNAYLPGPPAAKSVGAPMNHSTSDQVLSVFAPDEKPIPPVPRPINKWYKPANLRMKVSWITMDS